MPSARLNWTYDDTEQQFTTPAGRVITLREIATLIQDAAECRHDLSGPWSGWKIRGRTMIPPHASKNTARLTPENLAAFLRWASPIRVDTGPSKRQAAPVALRLAYSSNR